MNLRPVAPLPTFRCVCITCGKAMLSSKEVVFADLEGEPFKAYFCARCASEPHGSPLASNPPE